MEHVLVSPLLRRALLADAAASGLSGALLGFEAVPLSGLFGLPAALLQSAGLFCMAYAVFVAWLGTRDAVWRLPVWVVIVGNLLWVVGSLELLFTQSPTVLGEAYVIAQAVLVGVLAECEWVGLRRSREAAMV